VGLVGTRVAAAVVAVRAGAVVERLVTTAGIVVLAAEAVVFTLTGLLVATGAVVTTIVGLAIAVVATPGAGEASPQATSTRLNIMMAVSGKASFWANHSDLVMQNSLIT